MTKWKLLDYLSSLYSSLERLETGFSLQREAERTAPLDPSYHP